MDIQSYARLDHSTSPWEERNDPPSPRQNEQNARALWEVGCMLESMFLQAKSLGISCESEIFLADEISRLNERGVANAVTAVFI